MTDLFSTSHAQPFGGAAVGPSTKTTPAAHLDGLARGLAQDLPGRGAPQARLQRAHLLREELRLARLLPQQLQDLGQGERLLRAFTSIFKVDDLLP